MLEVKTYEAPELLGVLVLFEISPDYCRDTLTIKAQDAALAMGTVLMKNEDGTYGPGAAAAESADPAGAGAPPCEDSSNSGHRKATLPLPCSGAGPWFRQAP